MTPQLVTFMGDKGARGKVRKISQVHRLALQKQAFRMRGDGGAQYDNESDMLEIIGAWPYLTPSERAYLHGQYPELMGFWATLVSGVVSAATGIVSAIKKNVKKKSSRPPSGPSQAQLKAEAEAQAAKLALAKAQAAQAAQKAAMPNMLLIGGAAGLAALLLLRKRG